LAFDIFWMNIAAVFAVVNVVFVVILIAQYFNSWRKVPSGFTTGLILFGVFFLIQNVVIVVFWYVLYGLVASAQPIVVAAAPYLTLINAMEAIALGNLLRITWK
jgi:hypothetical protein